MDLKRYKHLVALADEKNFMRAAERLCLSQSALSRSIQAAEQEFGMRLFDRGGAEISTTPGGEFVLQRVRKLLFESRCLERDVALYRQKQIGELAFGMGPFPAATLLPAVMLPLRQAYPSVRLRVEVNNWQYLCQHLKDEALDFFVANTHEIPAGQEFLVQPLLRQPGNFYVRNGHPLLACQPVPMSELIRFGIASVRLPEPVRAQLLAASGLAHQNEMIMVECDDVPVLKQIVLGSDTVLAAVDTAVATELESGSLMTLTVSGIDNIWSEVGVVSLAGRSHSPLAAELILRLQQLAGSGAASA